MASLCGKFIVIDGMDGSGKGTQLALLRGKVQHLPVVFTREPGGTPNAEEIREMLLRPTGSGPQTHPLCDFFLFWAARASHVELKIWPERDEGTHFISDRYDSSTFAFQICGEGRREYQHLLKLIRNNLGHHFWPTAYLFLDLPARVAFERRNADAVQAKSRFDMKPLEYHERVRQGFRGFEEAVGLTSGTVHIVDANRPPGVVHEDVARIVLDILQS